jgi:signal transduction histidine kinase
VLELRPTVVPLEPLIRRILTELHPLAELRRAEIRFEAPEQAITALADDRASERLITRLFSVLLSNCVVGEGWPPGWRSIRAWRCCASTGRWP